MSPVNSVSFAGVTSGLPHLMTTGCSMFNGALTADGTGAVPLVYTALFRGVTTEI